MKQEKKHPLLILIGGCAGFITGLVVIVIISFTGSDTQKSESMVSHWNSRSILPWESIGGCGVSACDGGGASYQWIGRGLSETMLDYEIHLSQSFYTDLNWGVATSSLTSIPFKLNYIPNNIVLTKVSLAMPFQWKQSGSAGDKKMKTGGIGDMELTLSKTFELTGKLESSLGFMIPTGKYDIYFGGEYISQMQLGDGLFGISASLNYSIDQDWGIIKFGGSYSGGLFLMKTVEWNWDTSDVINSHIMPSKRKLSSARVKGGSFKVQLIDGAGQISGYNDANIIAGAENNYGTMSPDELSLFFYAGKKSQERIASVGLTASFPIGHARAKMFGSPNLSTYSKEDCPDDAAAIARFIKDKQEEDTTATYQNYFVVGRSVNPENSDEISYMIMDAPYIEDKKWAIVTPGFGLEFSTELAPIFMSFTLPIEINGDDGVGVMGFSFDFGIKGSFF